MTLPDLRAMASAGASALEGVPLADAPHTGPALAALGRSWDAPIAQEDPKKAGIYLVQAAALTTLAARGWSVQNLPGSPLAARSPSGASFVPFKALSVALDAEDPRAAWAASLEAAGVDPSLPMTVG
jgi:hypothetical protein